jgi:hypothetical protein
MSYIAEGIGPDFRPGERCEHIPPTSVVFYGHPRVSYVAVCADCHSTPVPQRFNTSDERDHWQAGHWISTGHQIDTAVEVRP